MTRAATISALVRRSGLTTAGRTSQR
jgi:hypothetical protein